MDKPAFNSFSHFNFSSCSQIPGSHNQGPARNSVPHPLLPQHDLVPINTFARPEFRAAQKNDVDDGQWRANFVFSPYVGPISDHLNRPTGPGLKGESRFLPMCKPDPRLAPASHDAETVNRQGSPGRSAPSHEKEHDAARKNQSLSSAASTKPEFDSPHEERRLFVSHFADVKTLTAAGRSAIEKLPKTYAHYLNKLVEVADRPENREWSGGRAQALALLVESANRGYLSFLGRNVRTIAHIKMFIADWPEHLATLNKVKELGILDQITWAFEGKGMPLWKEVEELKRHCSMHGKFEPELLRRMLGKFKAIGGEKLGVIRRRERDRIIGQIEYARKMGLPRRTEKSRMERG